MLTQDYTSVITVLTGLPSMFGTNKSHLKSTISNWVSLGPWIGQFWTSLGWVEHPELQCSKNLILR
jgi:hypothetical protein